MNLNISFRQMDPTEAIKDTIAKKVDNLQKLIPGDSKIDWTCSLDGKSQRSDVFLHMHGDQFHARAEDESLYKTFDLAINKLESQIKKRKA